MAHYAKVNNGIVEKVIVAESTFFDTFIDDSPGTWVETAVDGSIRKNYGDIGFTYDSTRDAFYIPKPYPSCTLNESTCQWEYPIIYPIDGKTYGWDEATTNWIEITGET